MRHSVEYIYELEAKIVKMYPHTRNKLCRLRLSEVRALQTDSTYRDRQTDVTKCIVVPHSQAITRSDTIQNVISNCSGHTDVENF